MNENIDPNNYSDKEKIKHILDRNAAIKILRKDRKKGNKDCRYIS